MHVGKFGVGLALGMQNTAVGNEWEIVIDCRCRPA